MADMHQEHKEIRALMAELRGWLVDSGLPIGRCFAIVRWTLTGRLLRHIAAERHQPGAPADDGFETRYRAHLAAWTSERIDAEWPAYCRETTALLDALERHMVRDEHVTATPAHA